jgi:hypothetical protein
MMLSGFVPVNDQRDIAADSTSAAICQASPHREAQGHAAASCRSRWIKLSPK